VLPLLALCGFYLLAVNNLWQSAGIGRGVTRRQGVLFFGGVAVLAVALLSPIDPLGGALFSAHMVQHVLLMMAAAPLLALGAPAHLWLWALPLTLRRGLAQFWHRRRGWRWLAHIAGLPLTVWLVSTAVLWVWHVPELYEAALEDDLVHALEHAAFLSTAWFFWGCVLALSRHRAAGDGIAILLLFTTTLQSGILGALMTFAPTPWYASYLPTTAAWGLSPLADQQLAGVIMWVPAGTVYLAAALAILALRLHGLERKAAGRPRPTIVPPPMLGLLLLGAALGLSGCSTPALGQAAGLPTAPSALQTVPGGDPQQGAALLRAYGCGSCHNIPGVVGAHSAVGPPLDRWAARHYIAGSLLNTPDNLIWWIRSPQQVEPGTAMPDLGVTPADARHMSAYLYTLQR
jgi:cytochrome c oxidase assembly factor CtaG/cytochrome c2